MSLFGKLTAKKERFDSLIAEQISPDTNAAQRAAIYFDYMQERMLYGINQSNYFHYKFWLKSNRCRRSFINRKEMRLIFDVCNPPANRLITADKVSFNKRFSSLCGRRWAYVNDLSYEDFVRFVEHMEQIFVKPADGEGGQGIEIIQNNGELDYPALYTELKQKKALIEEVIEQHPDMAALHPASVNTVRMVTLRDADDVVHIMGAGLRIGTGDNHVDNFHQNGIVASADVKTGLVISQGIDFNGRQYVYHPDTNKEIVGFHIPNWDRFLKTALECAPMLPELRYVGWDLALHRDGRVILIEGNAMPSVELHQGASQQGQWPQYKPLIRELQKRGFGSK